MFRIVSTNRSGKDVTHHVKPLQIIWSKFPQWNTHNTVHLDDLARNFALNLSSGLKCTAYYRKNMGRKDAELLLLGRFLELLATNEEVKDNFDHVDFQFWQDYVSGKKSFQKK
jgi:ubiquitin-like domain-containing CTD phosphatase 1